MKLGINGATIPKCDLVTGIHVARAAGFSLYEPRIPKLLEVDTPQGRSAARSALASEELDWLPINALENVFTASLDQLRSATHDVCRLAAEFGVRQVIVVPGAVQRTVPIPEAQDTLDELKRIADSYEISLLYEFIGFPHHAFPSLSQARTVAREAGLPLVLDTFHLAVGGTTSEAILEMDASEIGLVHLSDAIVGDRLHSRIGDEDRVLPGEGGLSLLDHLRAMASIGFDGPLSVEVFHPKYGMIGPGKCALEARNSACLALASAGFDPC